LSAADSRLRHFIERHPRLFLLTGAGCSTDSGIPDYRDSEGEWKRAQPVTFQSFMGDPRTRRRYWARSVVGWRRFGHALPNDAHHALARLEQRGHTEMLVTQNVDGLHQAAGSAQVIDLHGRLAQVRCMGCERRSEREQLQRRMLDLNPHWSRLDAAVAPDGDADLGGLDFSTFEVPACEHCHGILKPDVVFFGESVPRARVAAALQALGTADAMLVIGSSLMVYSGFRFAQVAAKAHKPIAAVNLGRTRADDLLALKLDLPCAVALAFLLEKQAA
jgi:NAD-dependent SIR2 family protein deacetylase